QTPTLALMVKREREIQAFVPEPYWLVHAQFDPCYEGLWFEGDETRLKEGKRAEDIAAKVSGADGVVESVERKEQSERAPLLYDLTSLQRDANRRFGFSARRTLQAAQLGPGRAARPGGVPHAGALRPNRGCHARGGGARPHPRQGQVGGRLARRLRAPLRRRSAGGPPGRRRRERERRAARGRA